MWECTAYPFAPADHVHRQLHEALTEPPANRCQCCGMLKAICDVIDDSCCDDCYHPADGWAERLGET